MGNKISCSCAPLIRKAYRYDNTPWQASRKRDGHLLRLWAEVFYVTGEGSSLRWHQVSEDLVPVNMTLIHDQSECIFHITAYNSQVDKILDVKLVQPGTKLCQASECFIYWRDEHTAVTWGLNFTSPMDARQFRECCSPASKLTKKAPSATSLKLEPPKRIKEKKSSTTPNSPALQLKPSTPESLWSESGQDDAIAAGFSPGRVSSGAATLPIVRPRSGAEMKSDFDPQKDMAPAPSNTSVYDNVANPARRTRSDSYKQSTDGLYISKDEKYITQISTRGSILTGTGIRENGYLLNAPTSRGQSHPHHHHHHHHHHHRESSARIPPPSPGPELNVDSSTLERMLKSLPTSPEVSPTDLVDSHKNAPNVSWSVPISKNGNVNKNAQRISMPEVKQIFSYDDRNPYDNLTFSVFAKDESTSMKNSPSREHKFPTSERLLLEYEAHLRNALAKRSDSDSLGGYDSSDPLPAFSGISPNFRGYTFDNKSGSLPAAITGFSSVMEAARQQESLRNQSVADGSEISTFITATEGSEDQAAECSDDSISSCRSESLQAVFSTAGATRKAGFIAVKNWLVHKKKHLELTSKKIWKRYWVCLKGVTLLFYPCDNKDMVTDFTTPRHTLFIEGALAQPVPEYPKKDNVFSLSTAFGDAYLFQTSSYVEVENWINSIHLACSSAFARQHGKNNTLRLLQEEIHRLSQTIDADLKMKKMSEVQSSAAADPKNKLSILKQIGQWEEDLEKLYVERFRLVCYMNSIQNRDRPDPKHLLMHMSKNTKASLSRLGVFTVTSFHAFVSARNPSWQTSLLSRKITRKQNMALKQAQRSSTDSGTPDSGAARPVTSGSSTTSGITDPELLAYTATENTKQRIRDESLILTSEGRLIFGETMTRVLLPNNQSVVIGIQDVMTVEDVLITACLKRNLNPYDHFIRLREPGTIDTFHIPDKTESMGNQVYIAIEVCPKVIYQVQLTRSSLEQSFGFSVEAELTESSERDDELCVYVGEVIKGSLADNKGIILGDEILVINGKVVCELDMLYVESMLHDGLTVCMTIRSCRTDHPYTSDVSSTRFSDKILNTPSTITLDKPPPPPELKHQASQSDELKVPSSTTPGPEHLEEGKLTIEPHKTRLDDLPNLSAEQIEAMLKVSFDTAVTAEFCETWANLETAEQRARMCPSPSSPKRLSPSPNIHTPTKQLTHAQRLRKVIMELVDTERSYVTDLNCLLEYYLEPLKDETFLSNEEIDALFGNIQEIVQFQRIFLQSLEEAVALEPDFHSFEHASQFKRVLFSLGGSFLYYANHFKLYSSFCASHSKAQKVLHPSIAKILKKDMGDIEQFERNKYDVGCPVFQGEGNQALQAFLQARNPRGQHSSTLESYLIKPIQRILKYPLLLQQLKSLTDPDTDEHFHLSEALKGMESVAEHINEMQRIHEEYGSIFDLLLRQHQKTSKQAVDLSVGELLYYGAVDWLNASEYIGKVKKSLELRSMSFVFKTAVVFLCKERLKQKKKLMGGSSKAHPPDAEIIRYQTLIPVSEVQVRSCSLPDTDTRYSWELVHLKSQLHGRPEKIYQLANSTNDIKNAFLKTIRQIIRESVRQMTVPSTKHQIKPLSHGPHNGRNVGHFENISATIRSLTKKRRGKERHSLDNFDDDFNVVEFYDNLDQSFRTRSRTFGIRKEEDMTESQSDLSESERSVSSSTSRLNAQDGSGARLLQSSHSPSTYTIATTTMGSPVWKPRDANGRVRSEVFLHDEPREQYIIYDEYGSSLVLAPPSERHDLSRSNSTKHTDI